MVRKHFERRKEDLVLERKLVFGVPEWLFAVLLFTTAYILIW